MDNLPDPIEIGERRCEDWATEFVHGDTMTCCCGKTCSLGEAQTLSPDPYAIPVCPDCFEAAVKKRFPNAETNFNE